MEKQERLQIIKDNFVEIMNESYKQYGAANNFSQEEVDRLISENAQGVMMMGDFLAEKIDAQLFS